MLKLIALAAQQHQLAIDFEKSVSQQSSIISELEAQTNQQHQVAATANVLKGESKEEIQQCIQKQKELVALFTAMIVEQTEIIMRQRRAAEEHLKSFRQMEELIAEMIVDKGGREKEAELDQTESQAPAGGTRGASSNER